MEDAARRPSAWASKETAVSPASPRCALMGGGVLLVECGATLLRRGWRIAAVVTRDPSTRRWAEALNLPLFEQATDLCGAADIGAIEDLFSIANLSILPPAVLALAARAAINFHDGPLPAYAGLNTPAWALWNGEVAHGVTWHRMTGEVDRGDILVRRSVPIDKGETAQSLNAKCFAAGIESFEELVERLAGGTLLPMAQPVAPHRFYERRHRPPAAGLIRWEEPAETIARQVRALCFGEAFNPLGTAKALIDGRVLIVDAAEAGSRRAGAAPGTIVAADGQRLVVATGTTDLSLSVGTADLVPGARFAAIDAERAARISAIDAAAALHEAFWRKRLAAAAPVDLPQVGRTRPSGAGFSMVEGALPEGAGAWGGLLAAALAWLARIVDRAEITVGYADPTLRAGVEGGAECFASQVPLSLTLDFQATLRSLAAAVAEEVAALHRHVGLCADLVARAPELRGRVPAVQPVALLLVDDPAEAEALPGSDLTLAVDAGGRTCRWLYDPARIAPPAVERMQRQFAIFLEAALRQPDRPLGRLPLIHAAERDRLLHGRAAIAGTWREEACVHHLIAEQAARTPDRVALICGARSIDYATLDARAERLAARLAAAGVGPDVLVGLFVEPSIELPLAMLAIHKAGGAYVPLDPAHPAERIAAILSDAHMPVVLAAAHVCDRLPPCAATILLIEEEQPVAMPPPAPAPVLPHQLAYVIYTSGSTGAPKGVMIEHRQLVNFFAGMDAVLEAPGVWLALTRPSFDISVLELLWTLSRGFTVVVPEGDVAVAAATPPARPLDFSLFYFASDAGEGGRDSYRLLLEGARFADTHGFAAVWTPERHFHAFGGLYPNPSVTSAALAAVTERVAIRAGSVVLPLHHPARVAEEWAVVDNLSGGRVGLSFAAGWQPDDFVLAPAAFADARGTMLRDVETVRRLWRGEALSFDGPAGEPVSVRTLPRPVQRELPVWLTAAADRATFEAAGRMGAFLLTHLLGQGVAELAEKIAAYRAAWGRAGHGGTPHVTLMLHSFVGPDSAAVRETVRGPLTAYLRSSADLLRQHAWSFPAFRRRPGGAAEAIDLSTLAEEELAALTDHAFERYYAEAGLFGTPEQARRMVERVRAAGVDEIACLIDFGVEPQTVLDHLPWLDRLRAEANADRDASLAALIRRHGVTHLQCTPSLARMMVDSGVAAASFGGLRQMLVGGEALPPGLAAELKRTLGGDLLHMYGPTETTIWSSALRVEETGSAIPLGPPLANQELFLLDSRGEPVPDGLPGEIVIAGHGLARGYLGRPDLTAERFVAHPWRAGERAYRTGDLGRLRPDGTIAFLGRIDQQVKLRGHRIEPGEIEAALLAQPGIAEALVTLREDAPGDPCLCAYIVPRAGATPDLAKLRDRLRQRLPEATVPAHLISLAALPRTPNGKIDRGALPPPAPAPVQASLAPADGLEARIAAVWRDLLKLERIGVEDNFFDSGGHSLLAVQLHRRLRATVAADLSIIDIFRFPTVRALARHLAASADGAAAQQVQDRALGRRAALGQRRRAAAPVAVGEGG